MNFLSFEVFHNHKSLYKTYFFHSLILMHSTPMFIKTKMSQVFSRRMELNSHLNSEYVIYFSFMQIPQRSLPGRRNLTHIHTAPPPQCLI